MKNIVAFIFARGGSKGLPGKNILSLDGKPLLAYSIDQAKSIKRINRIIVSTDSEEIAKVALKFGAEILMRPPNICEDDSPEFLSWKHAVNYLNKESLVTNDAIISIPTTSPLRSPLDLENCLDEFEKYKPDAVVTVTDAHRNPYFNMVEKKHNGEVNLVLDNRGEISRRQDAPIMFDMTTVAYVLDAKFIINHNHLFEGRVRSVHIPIERSIDIDIDLDFKIAELIIDSRKKNAVK